MAQIVQTDFLKKLFSRHSENPWFFPKGFFLQNPYYLGTQRKIDECENMAQIVTWSKWVKMIRSDETRDQENSNPYCNIEKVKKNFIDGIRPVERALQSNSLVSGSPIYQNESS